MSHFVKGRYNGMISDQKSRTIDADGRQAGSREPIEKCILYDHMSVGKRILMVYLEPARAVVRENMAPRYSVSSRDSKLGAGPGSM